jgi:hypothetical protein
MAQISCPWCSDFTSIRRSRRRLWDLPRYLLGKRPYRCRICGNRFYQRGTIQPHTANEPRVSKTH